MPKSTKRGFAGMQKEERQEAAAKGGRAVPDHKRAFSTNQQLASEAGRRGGLASVEAKRKRKQEQLNG